jgi:uncharacterized membrane protein YdjX (TVP38/TMEM64 family)
MNPFYRILLLLALVLTCAGLYFFTPLQTYLAEDGFDGLLFWIRSQGIYAPICYGLFYIVGTTCFLPRFVLTVTGGLLFGALWGTVINLVSVTLGGTLSFLVARWLGKDGVDKWLLRSERLGRLEKYLREPSFYSILFLRLPPLVPVVALNYGLGLTRMKLRDFFFATLIGLAPLTFIYTSFGSVGQKMSLADPATWANDQVWGPFVLVIIIVLGAQLFKQLNSRILWNR